eukprot:1686725-Rhodomonas_salina.1
MAHAFAAHTLGAWKGIREREGAHAGSKVRAQRNQRLFLVHFRSEGPASAHKTNVSSEGNA